RLRGLFLRRRFGSRLGLPSSLWGQLLLRPRGFGLRRRLRLFPGGGMSSEHGFLLRLVARLVGGERRRGADETGIGQRFELSAHLLDLLVHAGAALADGRKLSFQFGRLGFG